MLLRHGDPNHKPYSTHPRFGKYTYCTMPDCGQKAVGRGYCESHYRRWRHYGDANWLPTIAGRTLTTSGYVDILVDGRYVPEHRHVMAQLIDRPLLSSERVHHRNGDKTDNAPGNLELWSTAHPSGQRVEDKVSWAREIIALYGELFPPP